MGRCKRYCRLLLPLCASAAEHALQWLAHASGGWHQHRIQHMTIPRDFVNRKPACTTSLLATFAWCFHELDVSLFHELVHELISRA